MADNGQSATNSTDSTPKGGNAGKLPSWVGRFIDVYRAGGNVRLACMAAGISRDAAYKLRKRSKTFEKMWKTAREEALDALEAEAWKRAKATSDALLMFLLRANRPAKYRETTRNINLNVTPEQLADMPDGEFKALLKKRGLE